MRKWASRIRIPRRVRVKRYYEPKSEVALGVSDMIGGDLEGLVSRGPTPPKLGAVAVCLGEARCGDLLVVLVGPREVSI